MSFQASILLVEDEWIIAENLLLQLSVAGYETVTHAENVEEALGLLENNSYQLVITDIMMGDGQQTGIDLGKLLHETYEIPFIYVTAHYSPDIVNQAKMTRPYGYLVKPIKKEDLLVNVALALFESNLEQQNQNELTIKAGKSILRLKYQEIAWIEAEGNYIMIHVLSGKRTLIRQSLSSVESMLHKDSFCRIHKSYLVNSGYVQKITSSEVTLNNQKQLPIGRSYLESVQQLFR